MIKLSDLANQLKQEILEDARKASQFFKRLSLFNTLLTLALSASFLYFVIFSLRSFKTQEISLGKQETNLELLMKNIQVINEPVILLKIIQEKSPTLLAEEQCRIADAWIQICNSRNIPLWVACGLTTVESGFNPNIKDSEAGAVGWFQVMPSNARAYMNFMFGGYSKERLKTPYINAICGLNILADYRDSALETYKCSQDEAMIIALRCYNTGRNIENGFPNRVMNASIVFKDRFETPLQELKAIK